MPAYHSKKNDESNEIACGCAICPLRTELKGPAPKLEASPAGEDIIDEVLLYFRANVMFRNFEVRGGADKTLIYLTLHAVQCLVRCEKIEDKASALRELRDLSKQKPFAIPGEANFPVGALFAPPANKVEGDLWRAYFKQAREELAIRICDKLFADGSKDKWWQSFSKKKFMGKELKDF
jgi:actin related protein 2/3 complex subunit 3